jgi:hypothetical protein
VIGPAVAAYQERTRPVSTCTKFDRRVVPDAAAPKGQRRGLQFWQRYVGDTDVDGLPHHVQAPRGHSLAALPERGVRKRRTEAGDHLEGLPGPGPARQRMQQIEERRIDVVLFAGAEITKQMVQRAQRLGNVGAVLVVSDRQPLARVQMREAEGAAPRSGCCPGRGRREHIRGRDGHAGQRRRHGRHELTPG